MILHGHCFVVEAEFITHSAVYINATYLLEVDNCMKVLGSRRRYVCVMISIACYVHTAR